MIAHVNKYKKLFREVGMAMTKRRTTGGEGWLDIKYLLLHLFDAGCHNNVPILFGTFILVHWNSLVLSFCLVDFLESKQHNF